jgi:hypothetical protein
MARVCVLLAACLLSLLLLLSTAQQQQQEYSLEAFSNVTSCLPFNVLISPSSQDGGTSSSSGSHSLRVDAAPGAAAALRAAAVNGTLFLGFNRSFESTTPLKVTISLPAAGLVAVDNRGQGNVIINPGFSASSSPSGRVVALTTSAGNILARGLSTPQLVIKAGG